MYAPYPFVNARRQDFLEDNYPSPLSAGNDHTMRYRVLPDSWVNTDGFTLVTVSADGLDVTIGGKPRASFRLTAQSPGFVSVSLDRVRRCASV